MSDGEQSPDERSEVTERAKELAEQLRESPSPELSGADDGDETAGGSEATDRSPDIPVDAVEEAERLTRLAREAVDPDAAEAYRDHRETIAEQYDYTPRLREEDDTLVLYPAEWVEDGTVQFDRIEDTDRAVEISLSGPGDADRYREVEAYNTRVVEAIETRHGPVHAATARAFADFMSNHYVREVDTASPDEREEFRTDYFLRNAWPSDEQQSLLDRTLELIDECAADVDGV